MYLLFTNKKQFFKSNLENQTFHLIDTYRSIFKKYIIFHHSVYEGSGCLPNSHSP